MTRKQLCRWIDEHFVSNGGNVLTAGQAVRPELAGLRIYEKPLVGTGSAADPLFGELKREGVVGPWHMGPQE